MHADTPKVTGDISNLVNSIQNTGKTSSSTQSDRQKLISDLEGVGVSAKNATSYVDDLIGSIGKIPKSATTTLHLAGTGTISINASGAYIQGESGHIVAYAAGTPGAASGWALVGEQGPELVKFSGGEQVVPNHMLNGYAGGTPGADLAWMQDLSKSMTGQFDVGAASAMKAGWIKAMEAAWVQHEIASGTPGGQGGPGGGAPAANAALARKLYPAWGSGPEWTAWNNVAMRESGWSNTAINPGSGAYGIPQALPYTKMPKAAWPSFAGGTSNPTAQIDWMVSYILGRYGDPIGAWNHELSAGWYDNGGWLKPGYTLAYNGTGAPEQVVPNGVTGGGGIHLHVTPGSSGLDQLFISWLKENIRIMGGGNVQTYLGRG
jgi:SLT domain-containing protein